MPVNLFSNHGRSRKTVRTAQLRGLAKGYQVRLANAAKRDAEILAEHAKGGTCAEIGERMGISARTVKSRLAAARKRQQKAGISVVTDSATDTTAS